MKLWLIVGLIAAGSASAQEVRIESPAPAKEATPNTNLSAQTLQPKEPTVKYSGLAKDVKHDLNKSTNRRKFLKVFSLRKPADPKTDGANLIRDTRTEAAPPIKFLSVDF